MLWASGPQQQQQQQQPATRKTKKKKWYDDILEEFNDDNDDDAPSAAFTTTTDDNKDDDASLLYPVGQTWIRFVNDNPDNRAVNQEEEKHDDEIFYQDFVMSKDDDEEEEETTRNHDKDRIDNDDNDDNTTDNYDTTTATTTTPDILYCDVSIHGPTLQTGPLAYKIYNTIVQRLGLEKQAQQQQQQQLGDDHLTEGVDSSSSSNDNDMRQPIRAMALQLAAQEAIRVVLEQSGLELLVPKDNTSQDALFVEGGGDSTMMAVESIQLLLQSSQDENLDSTSISKATRTSYTSWDDLAQDWDPTTTTTTPSSSYSFVMRRVPVQRKSVSMPELLASIDPNGTLRQQAMDAGMMVPPTRDVNEIDDDEEETTTMPTSSSPLQQMTAWNRQRCEAVPMSVPTKPYIGTNALSYRVLNASDIVFATTSPSQSSPNNGNQKGAKSVYERIQQQVMDGLVSHGCLIIDVTNGGTDWDNAHVLQRMWDTTTYLFDDYVATSDSFVLPVLHTASGVGSSHAKLGFATYENGQLQFLETRINRSTQQLLPLETYDVLGTNGCNALQDAFTMITQLCQKVVTLVVAASLEENGLVSSQIEAYKAATKLASELIDDGRSLTYDSETDGENETTSTMVQDEDEGSVVSMSPHRLCRYSNNGNSDGDNEDQSKSNNSNDYDASSTLPSTTKQQQQKWNEIFGAHTDSTFVTAVPVAEVAGLEVFDEAANRWYRPELAAYKHYQQQQEQQRDMKSQSTRTTASPTDSNDKQDDTLSTGSNSLSWYSRYVVLMPGELLQLASRDEVIATVHRVVAMAPSSSATTTSIESASSNLENRNDEDDKRPRLQRRLSAPILLRGRLGLQWDCDRYLGGINSESDTDDVLRQCQGMTIDNIYSMMQPPPKSPT